MDKHYYVYMLASAKHGHLYIGMTNNLIRRVWEHRNHAVDGYTKTHDITLLVWFEQHTTAENAIKREKRLKKYLREWKCNLIEQDNPHWVDLFDALANK